MQALVFVSLVSALLTAICATYVARRAALRPPDQRGAALTFLCVLGLKITYAVAFACEAASSTLGAKLFWDDFALLPTVALPLVLLNFAQRWLGSERSGTLVRRSGWLVLGALPLLACVFVFTDPWHGQARAGAKLVAADGYVALSYPFTPIEWAAFIELYALTLYSVAFSLRRTWRKPPAYRSQAAAVALAVSMPVVASVPAVFFGVTLFGQRDSSVILLFAVGALIVTWALFRRQLFDLAPVPYDAVLDQLPLPIVVLDTAGRVVDTNPAALAVLGVKPAIAGRKLEDLALQSQPVAEVVRALGGSVPEVTLGEHIFEVGASELRRASGRVGRLIMLHDVSDRRRAGDALRQAHDALELRVQERTQELSHANRALRDEVEERKAAEAARERLQQRLESAQRLEALGRLAGGVAHDFNNLLTVILGNTSLLAFQTQGDDQELLSEVQRAAQSAASLTQQLLAFARRQVVDPRIVDIGAAVDGAEKMLSRLLGEDIRIVRVRGEGSLRTRVDPSQLEQVLVNLCLNARDAMPAGGRLTIETRASEGPPARAVGHDSSPPGTPEGYAVLCVSDTGVGIAPEFIGHVFEPFFTTKPAGKGTGLGLASVYGAVEQAGGLLHVESTLGHGSTFSVYLPRASAMPRETGKPPTPPAEAHGTIALVEDQEMVRDVTRRQLERLGYRVLAFASSTAALAELPPRLGEVDLLVSDVIMPEINGPSLASELRRTRPTLPVLFLSGYAEEALADRGAAVSDSPVLAKPFNAETLAAAVQRARSRARVERH